MPKDEVPNQKTSEPNNGIDRRRFLQGSLALGAGVLGANLVASSVAIAEEPTPTNAPLAEQPMFPSEVVQQYTGKDALPIEPLAPPAQWDYTTDVVIVGTGNAGLAASIYFAEKGVPAITLEKNPMWGGVSSTAGAWIIKGGTKAHLEAGIEFDVDALLEQCMSRMAYPANAWGRKLTRQLIIKGAEAMDWFVDMGAPVRMVAPTSYMSFGEDKAGRACFGTDFAYHTAVDKGAEFRLETECIGIVKEGDRIIGVKARDIAKDTEYFVKGEKGVLICSGGFTGNFDMLARWCPSAASVVSTTCAFPGDDGKCIRMGIGAGAAMHGWDSFCTFDGGLPDSESWWHRIREGDVQLARQPWLGIDITGNRFPYISYLDQQWAALEVHATMVQGLPGHTAYVFFDDDWEANVAAFQEGGCRKPESIDNTPRSMVEAIDPEDWRIGVQRSIDRGHIKVADNFKDIAGELGLNPDMVQKSVDNWNKMCEDGVDPEFNYKQLWLKPIKKPPFYGIKVGTQLLATHCGLMVDEKMQVYNTQGTPLPGLYTASMAAGGICGISNNGWAGISPLGELFLSFATGYIAAQTICGE